jgi:electron transport complex protein RnfE
LLKHNPILRFLLGLCPTLAITTNVENTIGMGIAVIFVLFFSNVLVAMFRKAIPEKIRIPIFLIIIVTFVTTSDLVMAAFVPALHKTLGVFVPLIVVNCIILGRVEAYAYTHTVKEAAIDAILVGVSYSMTLVLIGCIRELMGNGTLLGKRFLSNYTPMLFMILPPGAFLVVGFLIGIANRLEAKS